MFTIQIADMRERERERGGGGGGRRVRGERSKRIQST